MSENAIFLRLHHLKELQLLANTGSEAYLQSQMQKWTEILSSNHPDCNAYVLSVLANSSFESLAVYLQATLQTLMQYLDLPDDQPIKLIAQGKDLICQLAAKKEHCANTGFLSAELTLINDLTTIMKEHNIPNSLAPHGDPHSKHFFITTNMQTIRAIIAINDQRLYL